VNVERYCIVGTAPSWMQTPWSDTGLHIVSLNDAYGMDGFQRADEWVDLHPLDKFWIIPKGPNGERPVVYAHQVPKGHYVRPDGHLDWLATQTIPVWLHPDHATQLPASATWPSARTFPKAAIDAHFGRYFTSTPAWMLAHAMLRGAKEIQIYGIHLSTESEYIDQRPNFEYLMGMFLGAGKKTIREHDGKRYYEAPDRLLVMPKSTPILDAKFQYGFEPTPRRNLDPLRWELHKVNVKRERTIEALKKSSAYWPWTVMEQPDEQGVVQKRRVNTSTLRQELWHYDAVLADVQDQLARAQAGL